MRTEKKKYGSNYDADLDYDDDKFDNRNDDNDDDDGEPILNQPTSSAVSESEQLEESEDDAGDEPNLVRHSSSIVKPPDTDNYDEPNLVRLSSSIVRDPGDYGKDEPNLVRLESSIVKEPEEDIEELKLYTRSDTSEEEGDNQEEQRLVRAVPVSRQQSSDEPKLVRPNIVKAHVEAPKLMRPNIVKAKVDGPKLVRPNVFRTKVKGPKLVRANVQKEKRPASNLVRAKIDPDGMDVGKGPSTDGPPLVRPTSSSIEKKDVQAENFMYGANASTASPTAVSINSISKERGRSLTSTDDNPMEDLMYGAQQAATSPTAIPLEVKSEKTIVTAGENILEGSMYESEAIDDLMYGHQRTTSSPTDVKIEANPTKYVKLETGASRSSSEEDSSQENTSTLYPDGDKRKKINQPRLIHAPTLKTNVVPSVASKLKRYIKPSNSAMDYVTNWDAANPASTTANPTSVKLVKPVSINSSVGNNVEGKNTKTYVQPSTSVMDKQPDWDAVQPAKTNSNPSVFNVDVPKVKKEVENRSEEKGELVTEKPRKKKYVQPSASVMDNVPDWDAAKPAMSTSNPSVVNVNVPRPTKEQNDGSATEKRRKKTYVQPSTSSMDNVPDWDAVQSVLATSNPSIVNVDGMNRIEQEKRLVRPFSSSMEGEIQQKTRSAPADTPIESKQSQSIPDENPAGAKPIAEEEEKTKLPAAIAHAAGSSSDGWTPKAHFPSDEESSGSDDKESKASVSKKKTRTTNYSTMGNFDPDALPRPTGVIPLTVSSSAKDKAQLFRAEDSLEPVEDNAENTDTTDDALRKESSSSRSSTMKGEECDDEQMPSSSKSSTPKLFLYDGGNSQPKEPWDLSLEGNDTKIDKISGEEGSTTEKKLVAYDGRAETSATPDAEDDVRSTRPKGRTTSSKLQEKTVSPFTRNVSLADDVDGVNQDLNSIDDDADDDDDESKEV